MLYTLVKSDCLLGAAMLHRSRSGILRATSMPSLVDRGVVLRTRSTTSRLSSKSRMRTQLLSKPRFIGDVVYAPVYGRVSAINHETYTLTLETHVYLPHMIVAPVDGSVTRIDVQNGKLLNGVFTAEHDKEAWLTVQILCLRSGCTLELVMVVKAHRVTSRMRMPLIVNDVLLAGAPIGYAGGTFETRIRLPPTTLVSTHVGASVRGFRNATHHYLPLS